MDVLVEIIKAEVKDTPHYELQCQMETRNEEGTLTRSSTINLNQAGAQMVWPKFNFRFKQPCLSAVFLFNVFDDDVMDVESSTESLDLTSKTPKRIAKCLYPITFASNSKNLQHLATEISVRSKQIQVAYLTTEIEGSDTQKVAGKIWFKIVNQKAMPKIKSRVTWFDLGAIQDHLSKPEKPPGPSLSALLQNEENVTATNSFLDDTPTVSVIFHSVNTYVRFPKLTPVANIGTETIQREKSLFDETSDSNRLYLIPILKPVSLLCQNTERSLELYLADGDRTIFSAAHPAQMLLPFKQYNWEYTWRWMAGSGSLSPLHKSADAKEPSMTASVMYQPSASQYAKFEGLEFLVYGIELDPDIEDENVILSVQFADLKSKSRSQTASAAFCVRGAPFLQNKLENTTTSKSSLNGDVTYDTNMSVVKYGDSFETKPAYFFYPLHPFFRSKSKGISFTLQLYAPNVKHKRRLWWQASKTASATIEIPSSMSSVISNPENSDGLYWELTESDIAQSESEAVASKIYGVMRWKTPKMNFLSTDIESQLPTLRTIKDLAPVQGIQPGLLTSILSKGLSEYIDKESTVESISDYKAAVKKMGVDILQLREQNKVLRRDNQRLEQHLMQLENSVILSSADQAALHALTKADLIHKIMEQSQRLNTEVQARKLSQDKVNILQNSLIEKNEVAARFMQIQEAHSAQQKLVRTLQLKLEKYRRCADTCKQQEEVIFQLDSLLAQKAQDGKVKEAISLLSKENAKLRKDLRQSKEISASPRPNHGQEQTLRSDISRLRTKCEDLQAQLEDSRRKHSRGLHEQTQVFEAKHKVKIAAARESTLVSELEESARIWAQDKAQYEVQLAEYRAKVQILEDELAKHRSRPTPGQRSQNLNTSSSIYRSSTLQEQSSSLPPRSRATEQNRRRPLLSVSRQLHPSSPQFQERSYTQSTYSDSLDPRLSF